MNDEAKTGAEPVRASAPGRPSLVFWLVAFVAPALVAAVVATALAKRAQDDAALEQTGAPADYGAIPEFALVDQKERPIGRERLAGQPWIAGFAFTRCTGPCPRLVGVMGKLATRFAKKPVRFVTFSVDPENDTPAVLDAYVQADPEKWALVTGDPAAVKKLIFEGFHLPVVRSEDPKVAPGEKVAHSTRLVLVTGEGRIRRYYESTDEADVARLEEDATVEAALAQGAGARRSLLPLVNATLNGTSAVLLVLGFALIRARKVGAHRACMLLALVVSTVFLACYLVHHAQHGSTPFASRGWVRTAYFAILLTHVLLAVPMTPLALTTAWLGLRRQDERHLRLARITFPLWLYVSVTGVAVYVLLYVVDRPGGLA